MKFQERFTNVARDALQYISLYIQSKSELVLFDKERVHAIPKWQSFFAQMPEFSYAINLYEKETATIQRLTMGKEGVVTIDAVLTGIHFPLMVSASLSDLQHVELIYLAEFLSVRKAASDNSNQEAA